MLSPLIRRRQRFANDSRKNDSRAFDAHKNERGVTIAFVALSIVGIISMAALSIDIGTLYQSKAEAQRAADAAALTAARVISLSGITGDPSNISTSWQPTCGGSTSAATLAAIAIARARANFVGGVPLPTVTVGYGPGGTATDCSSLVGTTFAVNPTVTVTVASGTLPVFFAKIFSLIPGGTYSGATVSATAAAEAFNPSGSSALTTGQVSVQPKCVKPILLPNLDPGNPAGCVAPPITGTLPNQCLPLINTTTGAIQNPGIQSAGGSTIGVIGETFNLIADCLSSSPGSCIPTVYPPQPNVLPVTVQPNLEYLPALISYTSPAPAAPSCATGSSSGSPYYQQAVAGCDQNTVYQCGLQSSKAPNPNQVDLSENPGTPLGDTAIAAQCLINGGTGSGQDTLALTSIPYPITAGSASIYNVAGSLVSSSNSIVSLPIFDQTQSPTLPANGAVTIVGFVQVFINSIDAATGNLNVTVLNVAGCGNQATGNAVVGTSPVPVRLITPP